METFFSLKTFQDNKNKTLFSSFKRYLLTSEDNENNVSLAGRKSILSGSPYIIHLLMFEFLSYSIAPVSIYVPSGSYYLTLGNHSPGTTTTMLF